MISSSWHVPDPGPQEEAPDSGLLVTLHFLLAALRRRWRTWVGLTLVGVLLGVAWVSLVPPRSTGTVTLLLAHEPGVEPTLAMATDISLLRTRTVAESLTDELDLDLTPEEVQAGVVATPVTSQVLQIDVSAPGDEEGVERAETLAKVFLEFRTEQLRAGSEAVIAGNRARVADLEEQARVLTEEFERLSAEGEAGQDEAAGVLTERTRITAEILGLQQSSEETALQSEAVLSASGVVDPASVVPRSEAMRWLLTVGSALVGGLGVGIGYVLVTALASNRLRRRDEIALALGVPVQASVTGRRPRLPWRRRRRRSDRLAVAVHAVVSAVSAVDRRPVRIALAGAESSRDAEELTVAVAAELTRTGSAVVLVDLGERGTLEDLVTRPAPGPGPGPAAPVVVRPPGVPILSRGPLRMAGQRPVGLPEDDPRRPAWEAADVVLALAGLDPATDLDELASWVDRVVVVVPAGSCSAERLRSVAELVRAAGLELVFAVVTGADRHDESLGLVAPVGAEEPPERRAAR